MTDIIERLRKWSADNGIWQASYICDEAADEIEALRKDAADLARLRDLLHRMLETPTTQISAPWKVAVRLALAGEPTGAAGWRPIETAPKDGTVFIGWVAAERWSAVDGECSSANHDTSQVDFCWWRPEPMAIDGGYFDNGAGQIGDAQDVTHWMPLPEPPMEKP